jgi:Ca-activated chloride channel family protein
MNKLFSEQGKFPWGALIVVLAVGLFGCIIAVSLIVRGTQADRQATAGAPATEATPAAPAGSVAIDISSSNTKEDWMDAVVAKFNQEEHPLASGKTIFARVSHVTSGGSQKAILDSKSQPTVWSPGDQSWVDGANQIWRDRTGKPLVSEACPATVSAPIGFAMWRPMAEALGWPNEQIRWDDLVELSADPEGWASLGHPEWGQFTFGHTHPDYSNVGLLMMTALAYSVEGKTSGLTAEEVYSEAVVEAFTRVEQITYHYGLQNQTLMQVLAQRGPEYLHGVTTSEAEALKTNAEFAETLRFPLAFIFPAGGTFWSEQPYCLLDADWVSPEQEEAAALFRDYLLSKDQQAMAVDYYLRPVDESIPLHAPLALESGTDPRVTRDSVPNLQSPSAEVAEAIKDVFHQTKKKATIIMLLDASGSMEGEKIKAAVESSIHFIERLDPGDEIFAYTFNEESVIQLGGGRASEVREQLAQTLGGVYAAGSTPLYDAVCTATESINAIQAEKEAAGERRLYGIILLSDGLDTSSAKTENQMFGCLPTGESVTGVKVFTIAYGEDADADLMLRISNRTNGKTFASDPEGIESAYNAISAEQ